MEGEIEFVISISALISFRFSNTRVNVKCLSVYIHFQKRKKKRWFINVYFGSLLRKQKHVRFLTDERCVLRSLI